MKRRIGLLPLVALILIATQMPAWSHRAVVEKTTLTEFDAETGKDRPSYHSFQEECKKAFEKIKSAVRTYVRAVVTVAKAIVKVLHIVVATVLKVVVRFALAVVLVVTQWLLNWFLPV